MLTRAQLLEPLARYRTDQVVVTTMSTTRPWGRISDSDLDFASADSAMGHTADLALGIALAQPERTVVCLNGDGSMLMTLGTLATAVGTSAANFVLFVVENGSYEITGHQPIPGDDRVDFAGLARAAGFPRVFAFEDAEAYAAAVPDLLAGSGPTFVHVRVERGREGPISRTEAEEARYLRSSLADWSRTMRRALTG
ncbi:MAG: thiamine pyrophosphate-dependent enzyme [Gemmatimonadetes bacterium]|nr:thiamine pyrophosphate-dependent enzyme [Gemmatimonadota bacterium]